jgi:hypothetical protein
LAQSGPRRFNHEAGAGQVVDAPMYDHFAPSVHEKMQKDHNEKVSFPIAAFTVIPKKTLPYSFAW